MAFLFYCRRPTFLKCTIRYISKYDSVHLATLLIIIQSFYFLYTQWSHNKHFPKTFRILNWKKNLSWKTNIILHIFSSLEFALGNQTQFPTLNWHLFSLQIAYTTFLFLGPKEEFLCRSGEPATIVFIEFLLCTWCLKTLYWIGIMSKKIIYILTKKRGKKSLSHSN